VFDGVLYVYYVYSIVVWYAIDNVLVIYALCVVYLLNVGI